MQIEPASAVSVPASTCAASISAFDRCSKELASAVTAYVAMSLGKKSVRKVKPCRMSDVEPSSEDDNDCASPCGKSSSVQPASCAAVVPSAAIDSGITCIDSDGDLPDLNKMISCSAAGALSCNSIEQLSADSNVKPDSCPSAKRKLLLLPGIESAAQEVRVSSDSETEVKNADPCLSLAEHPVIKETESGELDRDNLHLLHVLHMESDASDKKVPSREEASTCTKMVPTSVVNSSCTKLRRTVDKLAADIPPPHLSGMFGEIVSLDDDMDESQLRGTPSYHAGVEKLMERLVSHSRGARAARKPKTIEVRFVMPHDCLMFIQYINFTISLISVCGEALGKS